MEIIGGISFMDKIFLSHSSNDKNYVRPIFNYFGKDRSVFDEMTFEFGMKTIEEIFKGIDSSDIFVFFISNDSLNSKWVSEELSLASQKLCNDQARLSQIYPVIIDTSVLYSDPRIPTFMKTGFTAYNLHHINNPKIACKKIESQLVRLKINSNLEFNNKINFFYGRELEKKAFRESFDSFDDFGHHKTIKCLIVSGIDGIGRKAYARDVLKTSEIMEKYYFPFSISLSQSDDITDFINKICDLGIGDYTMADILSLKTLEERIDILADLLIQLQELHEYLFIDDDFCLVKSTGLVFWLEKTFEKIQSSIVLVIATRIRIDFYKYNKSKDLFCIALDELSKSECSGLLRGYSKIQGMPFQLEDIEFFSNILTGYPPQIKYCVDLAISEGSIQYVKDNSYKVANYPKTNSAKIINTVIEKEYELEYKGFLALLSYMDTVPITLINYIIKKTPIYKDILNKLRLYSLCKYTGASGEYIKLNAVISDYIQRSDFTLSDEIEDILKENIDEFYNNINNSNYLDYLSFSEFVYYVKENLKSGKKLPDKFLYSTIYVKSVIELYNKKEYNRVIEIINNLKLSNNFLYIPDESQRIIQFYFCSSLARNNNPEFESNVIYFKEKKLYQEYNFLKGFNNRLRGNYKYAEESYQNVLNDNPRHAKARRELVLIYINLQQYDIALDLAEQNYRDYPENMYQIQAYFDCLIHNPSLNAQQSKDLEDMLESARIIANTKITEMYYQIEAKYAAFIENNYRKAEEFIKKGLNAFPHSFYLNKDYFDICHKNHDILGMEKALKELKENKLVNDNYKITIDTRETLLDAYKGKSPISLRLKLNNFSYLPEKAYDSLYQTILQISNQQK